MAHFSGKSPSPKPFRDALRAEIASAGPDNMALRRLAAALIARGGQGDVSAIKEIGDRLDGKIPQAIVGDSEYDPIGVKRIMWLDGLDRPPHLTHQANLELTAEEVRAPVEEPAPFKFRYRTHRIRGPEYNAKAREYMRKRRAAERALKAQNGGSKSELLEPHEPALNVGENVGRPEDGD